MYLRKLVKTEYALSKWHLPKEDWFAIRFVFATPPNFPGNLGEFCLGKFGPKVGTWQPFQLTWEHT